MKKSAVLLTSMACLLLSAGLATWLFGREQTSEQEAVVRPTDLTRPMRGVGTNHSQRSPGSLDEDDEAASTSMTRKSVAMSDPGLHSANPETAQQVLRNGGTLSEALVVAAANLGTDDVRFASMTQQAHMNCWAHSTVPEYAIPSNDDDATRKWADAKLDALCVENDAHQYDVAIPLDIGTLPTEQQGGRDSAVKNALRTIAISPIVSHVSTAGRVLLNEHWPRFLQIPPHPEAYGPQDLILAWDHAVKLALCDELFGCGAGSPAVAMFCVQHGCQSGHSLFEAYRENLAPPDFAATIAYANWIAQQRIH